MRRDFGSQTNVLWLLDTDIVCLFYDAQCFYPLLFFLSFWYLNLASRLGFCVGVEVGVTILGWLVVFDVIITKISVMLFSFDQILAFFFPPRPLMMILE